MYYIYRVLGTNIDGEFCVVDLDINMAVIS